MYDELRRVEAAALEAVPGTSAIDVDWAWDGSGYEAYLEKDDGTVVTVKVDEDFNVTDISSPLAAEPRS